MTNASQEAVRTVLIMRHCKSDWSRDELQDFDRPLSGRGERDARRMGRLLRRADLRPDIIIASPAARTRDTAEIVAERCGYRDAVVWEQGFYGADPEAYLACLRGLRDDVRRPLIVGHNPAIEHLVAILAGGQARLPTGALARLELGTELHHLRRWAEMGSGCCTLKCLLAPRLLEAAR